MISTTFCPYLFQQFDTASSGPCCHSSKHVDKQVNNFKDMLDNTAIKQAQEDAINSVKNKICDICWQHEAVGIKSLRNYAIGQLGYKTDKVLKQFILTTGNVCNLSCRTCNPFSSSGWIKEATAFNKKTYPVKSIDYDYIINNHNFSQLVAIEVIGGEPLKDTGHLQVLRKIINDGNSKNCNLIITTNATNIPSDEMINIWSQFKNVNLNISVDAIEKQFEYIRTDGEWNKVLEFIAYVKTQKLNLKIRTNVVFSALNIFYLDALYNWIIENNISKGENSGMLAFHPGYYTFSIFTDQQRLKLIEMLSQSKFKNYYQGIMRHLKNVEHNQTNLDNFWIRTKFTKEFKTYDVEEYLPELVGFLRT